MEIQGAEEQVIKYHMEATGQIQSGGQSTEKMTLFLQQLSDIKEGRID